MKNIKYILGLALLVITGCIIFLIFSGVSLRTEPIVKPSPIDQNYQNIIFGVVHRLFPYFQKSDYIVWGLTSEPMHEEEKIFSLLHLEYERQLGQRPHVLHVSDKTVTADIKNCVKPCWIVVEKKNASLLSSNSELTSIKNLLGQNYFSLTILDFEKNVEVPPVCENEKRLQLACIVPISVRETRRYMKNTAIRYFFMRRYNEVDYFLFLEKRVI